MTVVNLLLSSFNIASSKPRFSLLRPAGRQMIFSSCPQVKDPSLFAEIVERTRCLAAVEELAQARQ